MQIDEIIEIVREAGNILLTAKRPKVMEKSGHANFVTETDEKVQLYQWDFLRMESHTWPLSIIPMMT